MSNVAKGLKVDKQIYKGNIEEYCKEFEKDVEYTIQLLTDNNYEIVDDEWKMFPAIEDNIHKEFTKEIIPFLETFSAYRTTSSI